MNRTQQSEDENEGFFKPQQKIIQAKQQHLNHIEKVQSQQQPNHLIQKSRPTDFNARIIKNFEFLNQYPSYLLNDKCKQRIQEMISLPIDKQKKSNKYLTLQQKYKNSINYQLVYSKLKEEKQFNNYIFSLEGLTDYNQNDYVKAQQLIENSRQQKYSSKYDQQPNYSFSSNFQSGNLHYVYRNLQQKTIPTFDMIIQNDTNTKGYNQWFYFSIQKSLNLNKSSKIKINIVNFIKKHLMFEDGVRPVCMYQSEKQWKIIQSQVQYKKSYIKRILEINGNNVTKNYYTLSFIVDFPQINMQQKQFEKVFIALNYPYPYKRLISFISHIQTQITNLSSPSIQVQKQSLCNSISNNQIPYLILSTPPTYKQITHFIKTKQIQRQQLLLKQKQKIIKTRNKSYMQTTNTHNQLMGETIFQQEEVQQKQEDYNPDVLKKQIMEKKKKIVLIARQHPGETVGSFVLQAFLKQLIIQLKYQSSLAVKTSKQISHKLLKQYTIYVFPMVNVDGVIYGNFRTNLGGFDLNRQWSQPNKWLHPQIFNLKKYISTLKNIQFILDFHGHSRKLNSFIYACNNPVPILEQTQQQQNYPDVSIFRLYPYIFSKECDIFSIKDCTYTISRDKIKTARINTFKNLKYNPYIFTLETGFFGYTKGEKKYRYKIQDFYNIGKGALQSLKTILLKPKKIKQILKQVQAKAYIFDMWSYQNKQDPGSQSNPSQDELNSIEIKAKVLSWQRIKQKRQKQREKNISPTKDEGQKKLKTKKQRKRRQFKKPELKSQKILIKNEQQSPTKQIKLTKINTSNKNYQKQQQQKQKTRKSTNQQSKKSKSIRIQYFNQNKKKCSASQDIFNFVVVKQARVNQPQIHLPQPNYRQMRQKIQRNNKKTNIFNQFKSSSNLLGTGISYFQNKQGKLVYSQKDNGPYTLNMLQINNTPSLNTSTINNPREDARIQSFTSVPTYLKNQHQNQNMTSKVSQNSFFRDNEIKDLFYSISKSKKDKQEIYNNKNSHRQRIYVVRQNRIVRVVNNVNKTTKSISTKILLEDQIKQRQQNLKQCQQIMSIDNKGLIDQIKEQINQDKQKKKKKVYLHPIEHL